MFVESWEKKKLKSKSNSRFDNEKKNCIFVVFVNEAEKASRLNQLVSDDCILSI